LVWQCYSEEEKPEKENNGTSLSSRGCLQKVNKIDLTSTILAQHATILGCVLSCISSNFSHRIRSGKLKTKKAKRIHLMSKIKIGRNKHEQVI